MLRHPSVLPIKYNMAKKYYNHHLVEFPIEFEELRPEEWQYLLLLRFRLSHLKGVTLEDVNREFARFVLWNRGIRGRDSLRYLVLIEQMADTLGWAWSVNAETNEVSLNFTSTVNLLPEIDGLAGPASHGADLTFGEFRTCTVLMNAYTQTHDETHLRALAGALYRPVNGGRREKFDAEQMRHYAERMQDIPAYLLWGVYAWFASFCAYLQTGVFIIDDTEVSFEPLFRRGNKSDDSPSLGLNSILYSVAESQVFGTAAEVEDTQLMRVFLKLLDDKYKADALLSSVKTR